MLPLHVLRYPIKAFCMTTFTNNCAIDASSAMHEARRDSFRADVYLSKQLLNYLHRVRWITRPQDIG
jgi:hypothetical protein